MDATTRKKTLYWVSTGLLCAVMAFSAVNFNLDPALGPFPRPFQHLGLPDYLRIELSIAKALGVLALLLPGVPRRVRGFAYAGFAITLVSASVAHLASGDGIAFVVDPLLFLGVLVVSYVQLTHRAGSDRAAAERVVGGQAAALDPPDAGRSFPG